MATPFVMLVIEPQQHGESYEVTQRLVYLSGVLRGHHVDGQTRMEPHELESPRHVGDAAHDLRIDEVADAHQRAAHRDGDHYSVQPPYIGRSRLAGGDPHADQHADGRAVAGHAAVADLGDDGQRIGHVVRKFVKEAVPQTRAYDGSEGYPDETHLDQIGAEPLSAREVREEAFAQKYRQGPCESVISQIERSDGEHHRIEIPDYV